MVRSRQGFAPQGGRPRRSAANQANARIYQIGEIENRRRQSRRGRGQVNQGGVPAPPAGGPPIMGQVGGDDIVYDDGFLEDDGGEEDLLGLITEGTIRNVRNLGAMSVTYHVLRDDVRGRERSVRRNQQENWLQLTGVFEDLLDRASGVLRPQGERITTVMYGYRTYGGRPQNNQDRQGAPIRIIFRSLSLTPMERAADLEKMLTQLQDVLNSAESITLEFNITFTKYPNRNQVRERLGRPAALQLGKNTPRGITKTGVQQWVKKHRCIFIVPGQDNRCFWYTCILRLAQLFCEEPYCVGPFTLRESRWRDRWRFVVDASPQLWTRVQRVRSREAGLRECFERWFSVSSEHEQWLLGHSLMTSDVLKQVEEWMELRFVLIDYGQGGVSIRAHERPARFVYSVYGAVTVNAHGVYVHSDFIKKIEHCTPLVGKGRFCDVCTRFYERSTRCADEMCAENEGFICRFCHSCDEQCGSCGEVTCEQEWRFGMLREHDRQQCFDCAAIFRSEACMQRHFEVKCVTSAGRMCMECGGVRGKRNHVCHSFRCKSCRAQVKYGTDHSCALVQPSLKAESDAWVAYDFECYVNEEGFHIPYLVTVWTPHSWPPQAVEWFTRQCELHEEVCSWWTEALETPCMVFWNTAGVQIFWEFLLSMTMKGYTWWAHNGRGYDHVLLKSGLATCAGLHSSDIARGQKFLQCSYESLGIQFRDSLSFLPCSLRQLGVDFAVDEVRKGYFPHKVMSAEYMSEMEANGWEGDRPSFELFDIHEDHWSYAEASTWYARQPPRWNVKEESIGYCVSDTVLLGIVLQSFQKETMTITSSITRSPHIEERLDLDPLQYMTLPSAVMSFFLSQVLPIEEVYVIDRYPIDAYNRRGRWEAYMRSLIPEDLVRSSDPINAFSCVLHDSEHTYVWSDCLQWGCPHCFWEGGIHPRSQKPFAELRKERYFDIEKHLRNVSHTWDCEAREFIQALGQEEDVYRLDPRSAYKGGKSEAYKFLYNGAISMVDFVSQYPTVLLGESYDPLDMNRTMQWYIPTGVPTIVFPVPEEYELKEDVEGVAWCMVLPPQDLYAPFLSYRTPSKICTGSYEVLYGLCKACMETRNCEDCEHVDEEREFQGTWTLTELRYAQSIGYHIQTFYEVWEYAERSTSLFRSFIAPIMKEKICSKTSGILRDGAFTEKGVQVRQYLSEILECPVDSITPDWFQNHPARRTVAKLMANAFTGKWGQKEEQQSSRVFREDEQEAFYKMLMSGMVDVDAIEILDDGCVKVDYTDRNGSTNTYKRKNDVVVAHITAYGRIMLNRIECALGERLLYVDTDSAYHCQKEEQQEEEVYQTGFRIGDLELEMPNGRCWKSIGRKSYCYEAENGECVVKMKGVHLQPGNTLTSGDFLRALHPGEELQVPQTNFRTERAQGEVAPRKRTYQMMKTVKFHHIALKRKITWPEAYNFDDVQELTTYPFGYNA